MFKMPFLTYFLIYYFLKSRQPFRLASSLAIFHSHNCIVSDSTNAVFEAGGSDSRRHFALSSLTRSLRSSKAEKSCYTLPAFPEGCLPLSSVSELGIWSLGLFSRPFSGKPLAASPQFHPLLFLGFLPDATEGTG